MKKIHSFEISSNLAADAQTVWAHSTDLETVNREFFPFLKMTFPPEAGELSPETVELGKKLFRSWILLFGLIPVEYDNITIAEINPGRGFVETSTMLTQKLWKHERTVQSIDGGCRVWDRVTFEPKIPGMGAFQLPLYKILFKYRHWRLKNIFQEKSS